MLGEKGRDRSFANQVGAEEWLGSTTFDELVLEGSCAHEGRSRVKRRMSEQAGALAQEIARAATEGRGRAVSLLP